MHIVETTAKSSKMYALIHPERTSVSYVTVNTDDLESTKQCYEQQKGHATLLAVTIRTSGKYD